MKSFLTLCILVVSSTLFAQKTSEYIPSSSPFVLGINFSQINAKSNSMDYSKYLKSIVKKNSYSYYRHGSQCEIIDVFEMMNKSNEYGLNVSENIYMYHSSIEDSKGLVYVFKLNDPKLFESKLNLKCTNAFNYQKRTFANGKLFLTHKISIAINGNTGIVFVKDRNYYDNYETETIDDNSIDEDYWSEKKEDNYKNDEALFEELNSGKITDYDAAVEKTLNNSDTSIEFRLRERQNAERLEKITAQFDIIQATIEGYSKPQTDNISTNANFKKVESESHDAFFFINNLSQLNNEFFNPMRGMRTLHYLGGVDNNSMNTPLTNNLSSSYSIDFENGKAVVKSLTTYNKNVYDYFKKIYGVKQNKHLFKYINGENLLGYMSLAVNGLELGKFYEDFYREILNNMSMRKNDMNIIPAMEMLYAFIDKEMLYNTLDGRAILACTGFTDIRLKYTTYDYDDNFERKEITEERIEKQPNMVFAASIGNQENAKKLFDIISKFSVFTKVKDNVIAFYGRRRDKINVYMAIVDDVFIICNDANLVLNNLDGFEKSKQIPKSEQKVMRSHNMAFKIFADKMAAGVQEAYFKGDRNMPEFAEIMAKFGNLEMYDEKPSSNSYSATAILNLKDESSNALYQLLKMMQPNHER
ncbi:MAG: hypothetical protein R2852_08785 [Bacteroidia bacterium]